MSITLYFAPFTRATRPRWLLEELGVPYELHLVDMKAGAHKTPEYLKDVHPLGSVPALRYNDVVITESGAIVAFLADEFADKGFAPRPGSPDRAKYLEWMFFAYATLEPALVAMASHNPPHAGYTQPPPAQMEKEKARWKQVITVIENAVSSRDYLLPSGFSAADVIIGSQLIWAASMKAIDRDSALGRYVDRCKARPAYPKR